MTDRAAARRELSGRLLVTAAAVAGFLLLGRLPLPLVDREVFEALVLRPATVGMFGLEPFLGAYVVVELVALVVPALRRRRHGDAAARAPLERAAWALALLLVLVQVASCLATVRGLRVTGGAAVVAGGPLGLVAVGLTVLAGAALTGGLARWIDRGGLASGFSVLLAAGAIAGYVANPAALLEAAAPPPAPGLLAWVPAAAGLALAAVWTGWLLRRRERSGPGVPSPTCGIVPFLAVMIVYAGAPEVQAQLRPWVLPAVAVLAALLAPAFSRRRAVRAHWAAAGVDPAAVRRPLRRAHVRTFLWTGALALSPLAFSALPAGPPLRPGVLADLAVLVAVVLDLAAELRARRAAVLVPAYPLQRIPAVDPALAALAAAGIPAFARGRHFRALFHLFAPYAPVELLVPPGRAAEAAAVCARIARPAPASRPPPSAT